MATITAGMVKELREKTGAGMMDCKGALTETSGDVEAAVDWLRKKGLAKAAKKAGRATAEGLIGVAVGQDKGVVVEVNSETDFVARNPEFQEMVAAIAEAALETDGSVEAISAASLPGGGTVADRLGEAIAKIGENMTLRRASMLTVASGVVGTYVHSQVAPNLGKIGVLVSLESSGSAEPLTALARQLAMHVAAANPQALNAAGRHPALVERERGVLAEKARASGKPANVVEKIVEGGLKTFYKEVCLLDQAFVHDPSKSVAQAVKEAEGRVGAPISVSGFVRLALGEGVDRGESDFAAEVAAAAGQR
jgi:elongation factor Ts